MRVEVDVVLNGTLERFAAGQPRAAFEEKLSEAVAEMLDDLGIRGGPAIDVRSAKAASRPYEILINGTRCRLPAADVVPTEADAGVLARAVFEAIHRNRGLVVSPALARSLLESWGLDGAASMSDEALSEFLAALVRHCISLDRAKVVLHRSSAADSPEELFERTVSGPDRVGLVLHLGPAQHALLAGRSQEGDANAEQGVTGMLGMMRDGLFYELGVMLPPVEVRLREDLDPYAMQFQLNDLRLPPVLGLAAGEYLVNDTVDRLALLRLGGRPAVNPANGSLCAVVNRPDAAGTCEGAGLTTWDPGEFVVLSLSAAIRRDAAVFVNAHFVRYYLDQLRQAYPVLVNAVDGTVPIAGLTRLLRGLVAEEVSIRGGREIMEALLAQQQSPARGGEWAGGAAEAVRWALRSYLSRKYARPENALVVLLIEHEIEARLAQENLLDDVEHDQLVDALRRELGGLPPTAQVPPILTTRECRKRLRNLIAEELPRVAVLSYDELAEDMNIQPIGRVAWSD